MTLRDPDDSNGGKLVLGGSDASLYTGEMNYIPLTRLGYWQVAMDSISVAGDKVWQLKPNLFLFTFSNKMYFLIIENISKNKFFVPSTFSNFLVSVLDQ